MTFKSTVVLVIETFMLALCNAHGLILPPGIIQRWCQLSNSYCRDTYSTYIAMVTCKQLEL